MYRLIILMLLVGCTAPITAVPSPIAPITLSGSGTTKTESFELPAGNYLIHWKSTPTVSKPVVFGSYLKRVGSDLPVQKLVLDDISAPVERDTRVYDLTAGRYYFDIYADGSSWSFVVSPG